MQSQILALILHTFIRHTKVPLMKQFLFCVDITIQWVSMKALKMEVCLHVRITLLFHRFRTKRCILTAFFDKSHDMTMIDNKLTSIRAGCALIS